VNTGMEYEDILMRNQELMAQIEQLHKKIAYLEEQAKEAHELTMRIMLERDKTERLCNDAKKSAEEWEDDALRLMKERNEALKERDEARRIAAYQYAKHSNYGDESFAMRNFFQFHKWEYLKEDGK